MDKSHHTNNKCLINEIKYLFFILLTTLANAVFNRIKDFIWQIGEIQQSDTQILIRKDEEAEILLKYDEESLRQTGVPWPEGIMTDQFH